MRPPEPDDLVKIRTYDTAGEAYVAKSLLAANGIPAMVSNESTRHRSAPAYGCSSSTATGTLPPACSKTSKSTKSVIREKDYGFSLL